MFVLPASAFGADLADADVASAAPAVTAPRNGALVTGKTVRVRVVGAGKGFEALVGSRDVSKRFKSTHGGKDVRIAVLRRGRDFTQGANRLLVKSGGSADTVSFIAGRRAPGMLKLERLPGRTSRAAVHVRARVSKDFEQVRLRLNGKRAPERLWPRGRRSFEALLGADEGVRFGKNKLVATVIGERGVYDRVARGFRVSRGAPLVGAGGDQRTKAGRLLLDRPPLIVTAGLRVEDTGEDAVAGVGQVDRGRSADSTRGPGDQDGGGGHLRLLSSGRGACARLNRDPTGPRKVVSRKTVEWHLGNVHRKLERRSG